MVRAVVTPHRSAAAAAIFAIAAVWLAAATTAPGADAARTATELTPAQQCVKDGHAIPTVTLPPGLRAARKADPKTVGGWAFLDANTPLVGARVSIVRAGGGTMKLLRGSTARTTATGTFLVAVRTLPRGFRIVVAGGRRNGRPFRGTLVAAGTSATAYVSPVSTILTAYRKARPKITQARAIAAVKRTLGIPASANLTTDLRFTNQLFDAGKFLRQGAFDRAVLTVVRRATARRKLAFRGRAALRGLGTELLKWGGKQLASGAVSYVGGLGMGWVLGQLGIQSGASVQLEDIKDALDKISSQLTELGLQLTDLNKKADEQLLATLVASLRNAESATTGKLGDLQSIADMAASKPDKAYLESQACEKLAGLYPLASGTLDYGYVPDLLNRAFFPAPGVKPLTEAFLNVVKNKSRWFTTASSDEISQMLGYWQGIGQSFLQVELEWQHAVHPCPSTPTPTASNCLALSWAGRYVSDTRAQSDTLPRTVPSGIAIDTNTDLAWAPAYSPADSALPHRPPATYTETFGPRGDWIECPAQDPRTERCGARPIKGISGACSDSNPKTTIPNARDVDVCAIGLKGDPGPFSMASTQPYVQGVSWYPPTEGELGRLVDGYRKRRLHEPARVPHGTVE